MKAIRQGVEDGITLIQIEGETGLGKTRLLDELQTQLDGVRIGRATCSLLERHLPDVPLAAALREALAGIELDAERAPALRQILPELALGEPKPNFDEIEVLEALVPLVAEQVQSSFCSTISTAPTLEHWLRSAISGDAASGCPARS